MTRSRREAAGLERHVAHRVERIGDDDDDRVRASARRLLDDRADDARVLGQQVVAAHARLAGEAGGDDDDVRAGRVGVVVRAGDLHVVAHDRRRLGQVERLALRQALDDVDQHDVRKACLRHSLGDGRADVAGADDGYLGTCHCGLFSSQSWGVAISLDPIVSTDSRRASARLLVALRVALPTEVLAQPPD